MENWQDLLAVKKIDGRSINSILNEGVRLAVTKTKENLGQYRKDRETIRTIASLKKGKGQGFHYNSIELLTT